MEDREPIREPVSRRRVYAFEAVGLVGFLVALIVIAAPVRQRYESMAIVGVSPDNDGIESLIQVLHSNSVLDEVVSTESVTARFARALGRDPIADLRQKLDLVVLDEDEATAVVSCSAESPQEAQETLQAILVSLTELADEHAAIHASVVENMEQAIVFYRSRVDEMDRALVDETDPIEKRRLSDLRADSEKYKTVAESNLEAAIPVQKFWESIMLVTPASSGQLEPVGGSGVGD